MMKTTRASRPARTTTGATVLIALGLAVPLTGWSGQTASPQRPVFRASLDVIQVDVSVLDDGRRPIRGLSADDFVVLENGVAQDIVGFVPIDVPLPDPIATEWKRDAVSDVRSNDLGDGRLFAIVMDDATIPPDPRLVGRAREIGRSVIDRMGPSDLAAVIFTRDNRAAVDFTNDRGRLRAAVDKMSPGFVYSSMSSAEENYFFYSAIRTLGQVSTYLQSVPQRRKAIVYVSTGVPVDPEAVASPVAIGAGVGALGERDLAEDLITQTQQTFGRVLQQTFLRAQHGNVNIYSVDPAGLGGLGFFLQNQQIMGGRRDVIVSIDTARLNREFLQTISEESGGHAVVNTNDFAEGITQIFRENSSYYLIGYASTRPRDDQTVRHVEVSVRRPGANVRTRSAYFDQRAAPASPDSVTPALQLTNALSGVLPNPDIAMRATVAAFAAPGRSGAALALVVGFEQPAPDGESAEIQETLDLLVSAYSTTGEPKGSQRKTAHLTARRGEPLRYDFLTRFDVAPGRYQLRLAAASEMLGKSGSVYYEIDVPDFARDELSLSGVVLDASVSPPAVPEGALNSIVPLNPTSLRRFGQLNQVRGFFQVYQGGNRALRPVELTIQVINDADTTVHRVAARMEVDSFNGDRAADYGFALPLDRLAPGDYLLRVEVTRGGRHVQRDIVFTVID